MWFFFAEKTRVDLERVCLIGESRSKQYKHLYGAGRDPFFPLFGYKFASKLHCNIEGKSREVNVNQHEINSNEL